MNLKQDHYYDEGGITWRVVGINGGSVALKDTKNGKVKSLAEDRVKTMEFKESTKPENEYIGTAQIHGGAQIQDRTIT